jgi:predicted SnoaL-like aldol condensation-catalyzing enzyme
MVKNDCSEMTPTEVVLACNDLIEQHRALEAVDKYIADDFIEHDPMIEGGDKGGFVKFLVENGWNKPGGRDYKFFTDRVVAQGEYVVTHMHVTEGPDDPVLVFMDIYRVREAKLVEHWHVRQEAPSEPVNREYPMY